MATTRAATVVTIAALAACAGRPAPPSTSPPSVPPPDVDSGPTVTTAPTDVAPVDAQPDVGAIGPPPPDFETRAIPPGNNWWCPRSAPSADGGTVEPAPMCARSRSACETDARVRQAGATCAEHDAAYCYVFRRRRDGRNLITCFADPLACVTRQREHSRGAGRMHVVMVDHFSICVRVE
jgi:hypothetical protein